MKNPYTGEALKTFERIHTLRAYNKNKLYLSPENVLYYVNMHGFLHVFTAERCRDHDGEKIYCIIDHLLTRGNLLQESCTTFYYTKEKAKEAWARMQADAEANTAEERPQEAATADGTTAGGESITTTETEPQRATERPQANAEPHHPANDQERQDAHKTTGRPQQTATDREETSPQKAANDQEPQEAHTAEENTTGGQTNTRTDKTPQEATQRPKRGTHSPATYEAHKTATAPAGDQGTTAGDKDNTRSDKAQQRGTQPPQETATAPQPATVSEVQEPANDQEPKTAADCHREPATRSGQTTQSAAPCHHPHRPATSPTEARNARRRTNYHHRRKNATQSHAGSPQAIRSARTCHRWKQRTPMPYIASPQAIRSAADCHRRNLPQGAQQAPQRTEPAQAIHAPPCHHKSRHKPRRKAAPRATGRQKQLFLETIGSDSRFSGKFSGYPLLSG